MIMEFDRDVDSVGEITTSLGDVVGFTGVRTQFGDVVVRVDNLPEDAYFLTVTVQDVGAGGEVLPEATVTMARLLGDVDGSGAVNFVDIRQVASVSTASVAQGNNFLSDTDLSGAINFVDIRQVASRSSRSLPNTPPTITSLQDETVVAGGTVSSEQAFSLDDFATPAAALTVAVESNDPSVVPVESVSIGGQGASRTVSVSQADLQVGSSIVTLTVSDGNLSSSSSFTVTVIDAADNTPPTAFAEVTNFLGQVPLDVDFDGSRSLDSEGGIQSFVWDFGDGSPLASGVQVSHTYTVPGTYDATLTVTDAGGETDELVYEIVVADGSFNVDATPSANDASRFLWQAAFGPSEQDVASIQSQGFEGWIDSQMALSPTRLTQGMFNQAASRNGAGQVFQQRFAWANLAVDAPDQLRQRVAWALIQIFVINNSQDNSGPFASAGYYNFMLDNAFGNYRDLLSDVTFSRPMGEYLTYINNERANPSLGIAPDENYAREIMQLFSIGLFELNLDGTRRKDAAGNDIPTYDIDDIVQYARVFTGLRLSSIGGNFLIREANPMQMDPSIHEFGSKQLLNYPGAANNGFIPPRAANQANGIADINFAIDNVFNHPNTPAFISRQLIQRLVTSNPTPDYVERVASVFVNDGTGTRGNLGAVVKAILLDPEARDRTYSSSPYFGKVVEPFLLKWALFRTLDRRDRPFEPFGLRVDQFQFGEIDLHGQSYLTSPTVFNFYFPDFTIANSELDLRTLDIPELQIVNEITVFASLEDHRQQSIAEGGPFTADEANVYDDLRALIPANNFTNNSALVDAVDDLLMYGSMSPEMRQTLLTVAPRISNVTERVRAMVFLTVASPEFQLIN